MKQKLTILMFGLLLAVGWTNDAQAQKRSTETISGPFVKAAFAKPAQDKPVLAESLDFIKVHRSHSADMSQRPAIKSTNLKAPNKFNELTELKALKTVTESKTNVTSANATRTYAPMRGDRDLEMKSLTKAEADALIYWWDNGDGQGPRPSKSSDIARDPVQMYSLLRYVYKTPAFPGPYYSAYTMDNQRERKVYYGAIEGGWNIPGATVATPTSTIILPVATSTTKTVADGTSTSTGYQYMPVYGYYFEEAQTNQMIYTASQLGLKNGDQITSITFYPRDNIAFSGGSITLSLANTTTSQFTSATALSANFTQVAEVSTYTVNNGAWTINFTTPFTYTGNNIIVQAATTSGTYGRTYFYGQDQSNYQSYNSYSRTRYYFLPKATFGYNTTVDQEVTYDPTVQFDDINITASSYAVFFRDITVYDENNNVITSWNWNDSYSSFTSDGNTYEFYNNPFGWNFNGRYLIRTSLSNSTNTSTWYYGFISSGDEAGTITIPGYLLLGHSSVRLVITALDYGDNPTITVNDFSPQTVSTDVYTGTSYEWTISPKTYAHTEYDPDYYLPTNEGYTTLLVAVKDDATQEADDDDYSSVFDNGFHSDSTQIVNYFANNVDSIILLTDGVRIGDGMNAGTVFNCSGTYNKFFFLGKGQARQKADVVRTREIQKQHLIGEYVPFRFMFEEFSPTSGEAGSQTKDFYSRMMDGHVYNVVHDCRSVIGLGHQFSMSGNNGTTPYAMTGLNFFVPDYRLKYWSDDYVLRLYHLDENNDTVWTEYPYNIDGRIMNPYQVESTDGNPVFNPTLLFDYYLNATEPSNLAVWYAQYNQSYAPKVGLYKITLEANAVSNGTYGEGNTFTVTLDWTSSLNEMAHGIVPQTYYLYYVTIDEYGNQTIADEPFAVVENSMTYNYTVNQQEESQTFYYIVMGTPVDDEHSSFIAWSNDAHVTIPGYEDFMQLKREHYESDFVIGNVDRGEKNYYRNFLLLTNVNDDNALTTTSITGGMNQFVLQRYNYDDPNKVKTDVATVNLSLNNDGKHVDCTIDYNDANEDIYEPDGNPTKYYRSTMHMQETTQDVGTLSVTGNGDIVITPSGYEVNFKSITVTADGTTTTWNVADGDLPSGWHLSPSNWWTEYEGGYYLDGGGYIYIPTNNATAAQVVITAYGDGTSLAKVDVNGVPKAFANGAANAETKSWTVNTVAASSKAGNREIVTDELTVCNGGYYAQFFPIWGYYHDESQHTQMIYPASMLTAMSGKTIKSMTFYPTTGSVTYNDGTTESASGINFRNGSVAFSMANLNSGSSFDANNPSFVTGTMTLVKTVNMPSSANTSATTWLIEFDQDFVYTGGDLLIDVTNPTVGDWGLTFFTGDDTNGTYYSYLDAGSGGSGALDYLPAVTFTYETEGGGDTPEPEEAGMVRMRLPMVDEFSALTADNDHPRRYVYVLSYAPGTPNEKSTTPADVPVLHTDAVMHGFYTLEEINSDTKRNLDMNVLNAEVELELANLSSPYYYTINRKTNARPNVETGNRAVLQHRDDNWYQEMRDSSPRYRNEYEPGSTYKCLDTEGIVCGDEIGYNDFMSYVPVVWTKGFDRRYYDEDEINNPNTAHNSYGASVFKTGAGQVVIGQSSLKAEKQIGQTGHWTEGEDNVNLYILSVDQVKGVLPTVSTVEYEPYMFRVFVESPNEKLRGFKFFEGTQDSPAHFEPDPDFTINDRKGPWCVWTEYLTGDYTDLTEIDFTKLKDETNWENNIRFAGLSDIIVDENTPIADGDLKIYVRFYYVLKGFKPQTNGMRAGGDGGPAGYGAEGSAKPDPFVGINELHDGIVPVDVTYVNPQGMQSNKPFDGVNIVVTRYSDGTTSTSKVIR